MAIFGDAILEDVRSEWPLQGASFYNGHLRNVIRTSILGGVKCKSVPASGSAGPADPETGQSVKGHQGTVIRCW